MIQSVPHAKFRRDGHNLHTSLEISLNEALFGFERAIEHLDGHLVKITRNEVTQPEFVEEIRNEGMPIVDSDGDPIGRNGTLFVRFIVKLPLLAPSGAFKAELEKLSRPQAQYDEL
jgi:DnaJ homolog subfamily B member 11